MAGGVDGADEGVGDARVIENIGCGFGRALLAGDLFAELAGHLGRFAEELC